MSQVPRRWRRNQDGAICRKGIKKVLEVLVVKLPLSELWALPGVSRQPSVREPLGLHPTHPLTERQPPVTAALHSSGHCPWLLRAEPGIRQVFSPQHGAQGSGPPA